MTLQEKIEALEKIQTLKQQLEHFFNLPFDQKSQREKGDIMTKIKQDYNLTQREFTELYIRINYTNLYK